MKSIFNLFRKDDIGNPPWDYYFLLNLEESEYLKYLAKLFKLNTGEKLPLKHGVIDKKKCKTFNQKIQWIKLYGITDLMRKCTDKVAVRDYVRERIGEEYLKPAVQIIPNDNNKTSSVIARSDSDEAIRNNSPDSHDSKESRSDDKLITSSKDVTTYFDQINFDKLPNSFVIKCNHGCKWQYIIRNKENFLNNKGLFEEVKRNITGWLEQEYWTWGGFEMQYRGIEPKIIIEELLNNIVEIEIYCFRGKPKLIKKVHNDIPDKLSMYDENLNNIDFKFYEKEFLVKEKADDYINQTIDLSIKLSKDFEFVRVDWIISNNKIYFNEMTFTPNSGLNHFDKNWNVRLGNFIKGW